MEVDPSSSPPIEENIMEDENQGENSNSTPGSSEQVTESGTPLEEYSDLWLEFKCVFCNQDLKHINDPKLLPCLHTACKNCLSSESNESGASSSGPENKQLSCPICSQEINTNEVVDHLFLTEYVQNSESLPEESSFPCTSCEEEVEGTAFCQECQEWLCHDCVNAHHRVRVTKDHTVRPKEEMEGENISGRNQKYLLCQVHSHEQLKLYCETCDKLTCRDCQLSNHKDHKYQFLTKACEEEKGYLTELLAKIKEKQDSMEAASFNLNKRNEEILERERVISQEIKTFAVKFITDINKRGKALLHDLNKVCTDKKTELNSKSQEFRSISERLKHSKKFAEAAITLGSETALVYSKKLIMNQLRRILRHRCEVPNPNHVVDIQFTYETNFLTQYISSLGQIKVDGMPLPGAVANTNVMLPMPGTAPQSPIPAAVQPIQQQPRMQLTQQQQRMVQIQNQIAHQQAQPMTPQGNMMVPFGQPQVTSSTDLARNRNAPQIRQQVVNNKQMPYNRNIQQQRANIAQQQNFNIQQQQQQANATFQQRQIVQQHQAQQQQQMRQQQQVQQQQQQQQQVQQHQVQSQQQNYNATARLPQPLIQNKSISVTAVPTPTGPSPNKQRAIAPRNLNNQATPPRQSSQQQRAGGPQLIVLDDQPNQKTMSNTNRLSHFPNIAATLASHPGLQIQPTNNTTNNNYTNKF